MDLPEDNEHLILKRGSSKATQCFWDSSQLDANDGRHDKDNDDYNRHRKIWDKRL